MGSNSNYAPVRKEALGGFFPTQHEFFVYDWSRGRVLAQAHPAQRPITRHKAIDALPSQGFPAIEHPNWIPEQENRFSQIIRHSIWKDLIVTLPFPHVVTELLFGDKKEISATERVLINRVRVWREKDCIIGVSVVALKDKPAGYSTSRNLTKDPHAESRPRSRACYKRTNLEEATLHMVVSISSSNSMKK